MSIGQGKRLTALILAAVLGVSGCSFMKSGGAVLFQGRATFTFSSFDTSRSTMTLDYVNGSGTNGLDGELGAFVTVELSLKPEGHRKTLDCAVVIHRGAVDDTQGPPELSDCRWAS